jgi:PmbA protein
MIDEKLSDVAERALDYALKAGADQAATRLTRARFVEIKQREGQLENLQASTSRALVLSLYVDGRYSSNSTSLFEPRALQTFIEEALAITRKLAVDPHRSLPDPALYGPTPGIDLQLSDPRYDLVDMDARKQQVRQTEATARAAGGTIISVTAEMATQSAEFIQLHSNGFCGTHCATGFYLGASVTARDEGERRPEDYCWVGARHLEDLPPPAEVGAEAGRRALARLGARKASSRRMTLVVENRAAGRLVGSLLGPLSGAALQQRRSCFEGKLGELLGSPALQIVDEPLLVRGLGSRTFDGDGLAARPLRIFTEGRLENYFIDVYYGRKMGLDPTSGSGSNLVFTPGQRTLAEIIAGVDRGVVVNSFLGGNANSATGDFSYGINGQLIEAGRVTDPVSEMNIAGNHLALWRQLVEVGDDPYRYSSWRIPSLVFDDVQFSGS